jgi:S-adenosylmethionine hydrolase
MPEQHEYLITLTTDFGHKDPFVGIMKGVILNINPKVRIIDISHEISPQDIIEASIVLRAASKYFPPKTIHVAVVDPGVGGPRRPILVSTQKYYFIGPDNGIFSFAYENDHRVIHITAGHYLIPSEDSTFHGRDIFAPVAAWLAKGITIDNFGEPIQDYIKISMPKPRQVGDNVLEGEVIYMDRFGNVASNISTEDIRNLLKSETLTGEVIGLKIMVKGQMISGINKFYAQAINKGPAAIINSSGLLEIYIYQGNAEIGLGLKRGDKIGVMV